MIGPTLSIVMPVYNVAPYLPRCLESLAALTPPADEIIVVCLSGRGDKDAAEIARLRGLASDGGPV